MSGTTPRISRQKKSTAFLVKSGGLFFCFVSDDLNGYNVTTILGAGDTGVMIDGVAVTGNITGCDA
ncbi:MAG TPA: hypothetical protein VK469_10215 [Candidatus Kapabacteria bacterium]|nr:hypothetical protein [Candidatus Kapabacteria bacterium]